MSKSYRVAVGSIFTECNHLGGAPTDLAAFERSCALTDPEARAVYSSLDHTLLFTGTGRTPVRFVPPAGFERRWPGQLPPLPPPRPFRT